MIPVAEFALVNLQRVIVAQPARLFQRFQRFAVTVIPPLSRAASIPSLGFAHRVIYTSISTGNNAAASTEVFVGDDTRTSDPPVT